MSYEEHLNDVAINMQNFQSNIAVKGWEIDGSTPDDGNCCFWAVSSQLDRLGIDTMTHSQLRRKVVAYIKELPEVRVSCHYHATNKNTRMGPFKSN